jgi:hypothetical protein
MRETMVIISNKRSVVPPNVHVFIQRVTPNKRRNICSYKPKTYYNAVSQKTHSIQDFNGWESYKPRQVVMTPDKTVRRRRQDLIRLR